MKRDWIQRAIVYVKADVYKEKMVVTKNMTNLMLIGDRINKTMGIGDLNPAMVKISRIPPHSVLYSLSYTLFSRRW